MWLKSYGEKNGGPGQASGSKGPSKKPKNRVLTIFPKRQKFVTGSSNKNRSAGAWDNECRVPGGPKGHQAPRGTAPSKKFFSKKMAQSPKFAQKRDGPCMIVNIFFNFKDIDEMFAASWSTGGLLQEKYKQWGARTIPPLH